jgi:hypothetical protein
MLGAPAPTDGTSTRQVRPAPTGQASKVGSLRRRPGAYSRWMAEPAAVLARLAADLAEVLGDDLLSLALHGSSALGDFAPGRSDLDVLAVMAFLPDSGVDSAGPRL